MDKTFACLECGHEAHQWFGRCPNCGAWSSAGVADESGDETLRILSLAEAGSGPERFSTANDETDRVLGGGLVPGSVVLLAGEPGIGKSTLVLQLMGGLTAGGHTALLVSGEESIHQIALRAARLGLSDESLNASASSSLTAVLSAMDKQAPKVLVIDSIQTLSDPRMEQTAGSPVQVRGCANELVRSAKRSGCAVIVVGHVTKDGAVAGPKTLEHVVDVVLVLEGERTGTLRLLRSVKNRFGACDETGVFLMGGRGLEAVVDPSALMLAERREGIAGSIVFPGLEGSRPLLVEIQALQYESDLPQARRVAIGTDAKRLALLLGVLNQRAGVMLGQCDVFLAAAGGIVVREPAADLAICLALASAVSGAPVASGTVACGEVGLAGEIRRVPGAERRLAEAARLGFTNAIVPWGVERVPAGMHAVAVRDLSEALTLGAPAAAGALVRG